MPTSSDTLTPAVRAFLEQPHVVTIGTVNDDVSVDTIGTQDLLAGGGGNDWFIYKAGEDRVRSMSAVEASEDLPITA